MVAAGVHVAVGVTVGVVRTVQTVQLAHDAHHRAAFLSGLGGAAGVGDAALHRQAEALKGLLHFLRGTKLVEAQLRMAIDIVSQREDRFAVLIDHFAAALL